jgi:hypothetical protein
MSSMATRSVRALCPGCGQDATLTIRTQLTVGDAGAHTEAQCSNGCQLSEDQVAELTDSAA